MGFASPDTMRCAAFTGSLGMPKNVAKSLVEPEGI